MRFKPHGGTTVSAEDRIIAFAPAGTGNAEEIDRLMAALAGIVLGLGGRAWAALLLVPDAGTLLTPDAEARLAAAVPALHGGGLAALAIAGRPADELWILEAQFGRIFAGHPVDLAVISDPAAARSWLRVQLGDDAQ